MSSLDRIGAAGLDWLFHTAWQAAALVLLILALQRVLGARMSPRWRLALWWIVILRLVLPPISLPGVDVAGETPWERTPAAPVYVAPAPLPEIAVVPAEAPPSPAPFAGPPPAVRYAPVALTPPPADPAATGIAAATLFALLWLVGAIGLAALTLILEIRMLRRLGRGPPILDARVLAIVADAGIRRRVAVHESPGVEVPSLIGVFRPRLLLPESALTELTDAELRYVIRHELEHVRHHDLAVNWLLHIVLCLHWMNPFAWIAIGRLRCERETVRDFGVIHRTPGATGREYGRTILRILEFSSRVGRSPARVALLSSSRDVKRRIAMLARHEHPRRGGILIGGLVALVLATSALVLASDPAAEATGGEKAAPAVPAGTDRPRVLVVGFSNTGAILEKEKNLDRSLETMTEAILADTHQTVSGWDVEAACKQVGRPSAHLAGSPALRLEVARALGVDQCLTGWACSFGDKVVLVLEVIDVANGLPGQVHRVTCEGLEGIPQALKDLLGTVGTPTPKKPTVPDAEPAIDESSPQTPEIDARLPEDELLSTYPNDAWEELLELRRADPARRDEGTVARAEQLYLESLEHARRLRQDRAYRDEWGVRTNVRRHPTLKDVQFEVVSRPPYLLFVQRPADGSADPGIPAAQYGEALSGLYTAFHRWIGKPLELPPLSASPRASERILRVFVLRDRGLTLQHQALPKGVEGYFSPREPWLIHFADPGGASPDRRLRTLIRNATYQLLHTYRKVSVEAERGEQVAWNHKNLRSQDLWLQSGMAEFFTGAMLPGGRGFDPTRVYEVRRKEWQLSLRAKKKDWPLPDLLAVKSPRMLTTRSWELGLGNPDVPRMNSLFYAQAWSFVRFLWNAENGKYRPSLLATLVDQFKGGRARELTGHSGGDLLRAVAGKTVEEFDWDAFEKEWRGFEVGK